MSTWHTTTTVKQVWSDAKNLSEATLTELLDTAQEQIIAIKPAGLDAPLTGDDDEEIPARIARLHWRQAQALHESSKAGNADGSIGIEGNASPPRSSDFSAALMRLAFPPHPGVG
jgi:hypothetical protein